MAQETAAVGANLALLFDGVYNSSTGMSFAASGLTIALEKIVDSSREGRPELESLKVTFTTKKNDEAWDTFLKTYATSNTDEDEVITYEDKSKDTFSGTLPVNKTFGLVFVEGSVNGRQPLTIGRFKISGNTANVKYSSKSAETTFEATAVSGVSVDFAADCFTGEAISDKLTGPGRQYLTKDKVGAIVWCDTV